MKQDLEVSTCCGGASGCCHRYGDEFGYANMLCVNNELTAIVTNSESGFLLFGKLIDLAVEASPEGSTITFDDREGWLSGLQFPETDERYDQAIMVKLTREEYLAFRKTEFNEMDR